ncbi:environmental stress-induced protein Ves [Pseudomonas sp. TE3786]
MTWQLLRAADYPRMPWKNGGGSTLEILRDGDGLEAFVWRLSIADVAQPGPFSAFNGYQRIITVLEGEGMQLEVDGQLSRPLRALDAFAFSGDSQVHCTLLGGAIRDFNLIYAPERCQARLQWMAAGESAVFTSTKTVLLFSTGEALRVKLAGEAVELGQYDCLHVSGEHLQTLRCQAAHPYCLIELS